MNALALPQQLSRQFPDMAQSLLKGMKKILDVHSFEDIERIFLRGAGLSPETYRSYLTAVKAFYEASGGLHPLQVTAADIEAHFDKLLKGGMKRTSAQTRMRGLKRFFDNVCRECPFHESPFASIPKKLHQKLFSVKRGNRTLPALTEAELRKVLSHLAERRDTRALRDRAIVLTLATTGLRAAELCQLTWGSVRDAGEGRKVVQFIGKGSKEAEQEIQPAALAALRSAFKAQFHREPKPGDALLYSFDHPTRQSNPFRPNTLWKVVNRMGRELAEAGVITRDFIWSPHAFRRTAATIFYARTKDVKATQAFTRHAQAETLLRHYVVSEIPAKAVFDQVLEGAAK